MVFDVGDNDASDTVRPASFGLTSAQTTRTGSPCHVTTQGMGRAFPDIRRGSHNRISTPVEGPGDTRKADGANIVFTPIHLMQVLARMQKSRLADLAHSASGRRIAISDMLGQTQAAG